MHSIKPIVILLTAKAVSWALIQLSAHKLMAHWNDPWVCEAPTQH